MKSPLETLSDLVYERQQIPFDWIIEYGGDGTIDAAWRAEASAEKPSPRSMLSMLLGLRLLRPRARDTRFRDACAAVLMTWAREDESLAYAEALAPWVKQAYERHPPDWYIEVMHAVYRAAGHSARVDLDLVLGALAAPIAHLRTLGQSYIDAIVVPPYRPFGIYSNRSGLPSAYARAIAEAVPAPSMAEIMALMDRPR